MEGQRTLFQHDNRGCLAAERHFASCIRVARSLKGGRRRNVEEKDREGQRMGCGRRGEFAGSRLLLQGPFV